MQAHSTPSPSPSWPRAAAVVAAIALAAAGFAWLDLEPVLAGFLDWLRAAGPAGFVAFAAVYVVAAVFAVPASLLSLGAGLTWGPWLGWLVVLPSATLGATAAFALGRTALRGPVERRLADRPQFRAIDAAIGARGFTLVALLRLSPLFPFNLLNYALGLTRVRPRDYVLGTLVGMAPGVLLYTWLGSTVSAFADLGGTRPDGPWATALYWGGLVATLVVTALLTRTARRALADAVPTD